MCAGEQDDPSGNRVGCNPRRRSIHARQLMRVCLPAQIAVELPGLGELVLQPVVLDEDAAWLANLHRSCEVARLECGSAEAVLFVEGGFAHHLVNAILGCEPVIAAGPLSRIERGLVHGALAALSARLGFLPAVRVCAGEQPALDSGALVLDVSICLREVLGRAWLCAPVAFLAEILSAQAPRSDALVVALELGRTGLPVSELAEASEGDVVVFDGVPALPEHDPWPVQIRRGDAVATASLRPDGVLVVAGGDVADQELGTVTNADGRSKRRSGQTDRLAANASAEVAAELGILHGAALAALLRDQPYDFGRGHPILMRRNGTAWAEGELFAVDNALAVRIRRKLAG